MRGRTRWLVLGFAAGAATAFGAGLLRRRQLVARTGYVPPVSATGPRAVPDPVASIPGEHVPGEHVPGEQG
jgi:hypothetical protein